jgi:hypothetical protein
MGHTTTDAVETHHPPRERTVSTATLARVAGLLYLLIFVTAGFGEGVVRATLVVPGDPAATAANVVASAGLFRLGVVADLVAFSADAVVAVLLYVLLRPANRPLALVAATLRLVAHPAIASLNTLNQFMALQILTRPEYQTAFDPAQRQALASLLLAAHEYGYLIAGIFFGLHLLALGALLVRSALFPSPLGVLVAIAGVGYLAESGTFLLVPAYEPVASALVVVTAVAGELTLALYLVVRGTRSPAPSGGA